MRRLPTLSPRQYERVALLALVLLFAIVLTGAAVRLTGSGLGCTNWPKCGDTIYAPLEFNAWVEFGNRLVTGVVGLPCLAAFLLAFRRRPPRRDLKVLSALLPIGVLAQAILGGLTVIFELKPGFVMAHFLLSMAILAAAVALYWRSRHERGSRPAEARPVTLATRALLPLGTLAIFAGTFATAAGPHPGHNEGHEPIGRFDAFGVDTLDTLIHWHGRTGTLLGLASLAAWWLARRHGASAELRRALTVLCLLVASQGVIGFVQYELQLPAGIVWVHVLVAAATWIAICFANAAAPRAVRQPSTPQPSIPTSGEAPSRTLVRSG